MLAVPTLDQVRSERARRAAQTSAAESERRLETERQEKLNRQVEIDRCANDIHYWFDNYVWTYDPRLVGERNPDGFRKSPYVRFVLWPKQHEGVDWIEARTDANEEGLVEKSRDTGVTYLCAGFALHRWLFVAGFKTTFGSRKVDYVDKKDNPDSIFEKVRVMYRRLPDWMLPDGFMPGQHDNYMRLTNPATGAMIAGEGGEDMGRGGRSSLYFVDEAAFVPNAETVEKALSGNTDCVIWVSSVNGMGNLFARKRHSVLQPHQVFRLHWRDDPRKTEQWAAAKEASLSDPTAWASEYEIDYSASLEGVCIPAAWVASAKRLAKLDPRILETNMDTIVGLDVGAGKAKSVAIPKRGPVVLPAQSRGDPDTIGTAQWALEIAKEAGATLLNFDSPGVGVGVTSAMKHADLGSLAVQPINTGDSPNDMRRWEDGKRSDELFGNLKAEIWWLARVAFQRTHQHVQWLEGVPAERGAREHPLPNLISLPSGTPETDKLNVELSTVRYFKNEKGMIVIERKEELKRRGIKSPDYADALVLCFVDKRRGGYNLAALAG